MPSYDAFISYSHKSSANTAATLQKGLQNLNRRWFGPRRLHIFRDQTDLSLAPSLWSVIEQALSSSRFFILLCSPEAAQSKWVTKEVLYWLANKSTTSLLLVITSGGYAWEEALRDFDHDVSSAIPPVLFSVFRDEPLFLDLREIRLISHRNPEAQAAIATIAAPIHGKSKEDLLGAEVQLFRRRLLIAIFAFATIAVLAVAFLWQAEEARKQRDTARQQRNHAESQLLAARSSLGLQQHNASIAFWNAVDAWRTDPNWVSQKALYDFASSALRVTFDH